MDCLVGGMNGNVHYFRRTGELDTPTYTHRVSNIFPFAFNQTSTGFGSLRSSRNTLKALGLGSAFAMSALTSASTAIAVSAAGGILLQATGADAVNVYLNPYNRRTAAVPFYGYFNSSETHMKCVCGSAEGNVELFSQVSAASKNKTIGEVGRADSFYLQSASLFEASTSVEAAPFSTPSGLDLDGDGNMDFIVGSRNGTARVFLYSASTGNYEEVVTQRGRLNSSTLQLPLSRYLHSMYVDTLACSLWNCNLFFMHKTF